MRMHRHHLLEIILWPNSDGTFRKILNSKKRLRELGIYDDWKLTITIPAGEHIRMHANNRSDDTTRKMSAAKKGEKHPMYGKQLSEETKSKMSAAKKCMSAETRQKMSAAKKGRKLSEEHRANLSAAISAAHKGRHWYNNGVVNKFAKECQPGFTRGRIYKRKKSS